MGRVYMEQREVASVGDVPGSCPQCGGGVSYRKLRDTSLMEPGQGHSCEAQCYIWVVK